MLKKLKTIFEISFGVILVLATAGYFALDYYEKEMQKEAARMEKEMFPYKDTACNIKQANVVAFKAGSEAMWAVQHLNPWKSYNFGYLFQMAAVDDAREVIPKVAFEGVRNNLLTVETSQLGEDDMGDAICEMTISINPNFMDTIQVRSLAQRVSSQMDSDAMYEANTTHGFDWREVDLQEKRLLWSVFSERLAAPFKYKVSTITGDISDVEVPELLQDY